MRVCTTAGEMRAASRASERPLALVPTMGALHAGHLALVGHAQTIAATVAASIFVNPLQFAPGEDFARYPRAFADDCARFAAAGVALLYAPEAEAMYPPDFAVRVEPGSVGDGYEGALRPGHFTGVATVVLKLVNACEPDVLVMGQKDAQQLAVLARMLRDLDLPTRIDIVPTMRADDGLALSSRNAYLTPDERLAAPGLYRALCIVRDGLRAGAERAPTLARARAAIEPPLRETYLDVVDPLTFVPCERFATPALVIGSASIGTTRLLDNIPVPD